MLASSVGTRNKDAIRIRVKIFISAGKTWNSMRMRLLHALLCAQDWAAKRPTYLPSRSLRHSGGSHAGNSIHIMQVSEYANEVRDLSVGADQQAGDVIVTARLFRDIHQRCAGIFQGRSGGQHCFDIVVRQLSREAIRAK
jgi:hypothetical protein